MSIQNDLSALSTVEGTLTSNKVSRLAYTQEAYDTNDADGVTVYDVDQEQNIPTSSPSVMKVNETVVDRGFRSQASSIPRMFLNHFLGRLSYNLNKVNDIMASLLSSLSGNLGVANGIATLDSNGRIPFSQLPESAVEYKGGWDASTNTPSLADGTGTNGDMYIVNTGGTQDLGSGNITFFPNDRVIYNGSVWQRFSAGDVRSVAGLTPDPTTGNIDITGGASSIMSANLTADKALVSDVNGKVSASGVSSTELGYLSGATSNVQNQLNDKMGFNSNGYKALKENAFNKYSAFSHAFNGKKEIVKDVVYAYGYYYVTTASEIGGTNKAHVYKVDKNFIESYSDFDDADIVFTTTNNSMCIHKIIYAEALDMLVIAIVSGSSTGESESGVWYSTDEGATWVQSNLKHSIRNLEYVEDWDDEGTYIFVAGATSNASFTWVTKNAWYTEDITGAWTAIRTDSVFSNGISTIKIDPSRKTAYLGYQPHSSSVIGISWFTFADKQTGRFTGSSNANGQTIIYIDISPNGRYMFMGTYNKGYFWSVRYPDAKFNVLTLPSTLGSERIYNALFIDDSTVVYTTNNSNAIKYINLSKSTANSYTLNLQGEARRFSADLSVVCTRYRSLYKYNGDFYLFINEKEICRAELFYLRSQTNSNNDYKGFTLDLLNEYYVTSSTWETNMLKGVNDLLFVSSGISGCSIFKLPSSETNWIDVMKTLAENENGVLVPPDTQA